MTRPLRWFGTVTWTVEFEVALQVIMDHPMANRVNTARGYQRTHHMAISRLESSRAPMRIRFRRGPW